MNMKPEEQTKLAKLKKVWYNFQSRLATIRKKQNKILREFSERVSQKQAKNIQAKLKK